MKKTILSLAFVAALLTSCKEKTQEEAAEAADAITTEVSDAVDSTAANAGDAVDTAQAKVAGAVEAGAAKVEEVAKEAKENAKK